jgi:hypothetical protein
MFSNGSSLLSLGSGDKNFDFDFFTSDEMSKPKSNLVFYIFPAHSFLDRRINSEHVHGRGFHNGAEREVPAHEGNTDLNEIGKHYQTSI